LDQIVTCLGLLASAVNDRNPLLSRVIFYVEGKYLLRGLHSINLRSHFHLLISQANRKATAGAPFYTGELRPTSRCADAKERDRRRPAAIGGRETSGPRAKLNAAPCRLRFIFERHADLSWIRSSCLLFYLDGRNDYRCAALIVGCPHLKAASVNPTAQLGRARTNSSEIAKMAEDYIWDIRRRVVYGREMYAWAVIECAVGKTVRSGEELLHSSALKSAMKAIRQLENQNNPGGISIRGNSRAPPDRT
jgi:hypothetical protein